MAAQPDPQKIISQMRAEQTRQRNRIRQLEGEVARLREEAEKVIKQVGKAAKTSRAQAQSAIDKTKNALQMARSAPHTFFAPGQLGAIEQGFSRCQAYFQAGMTDAAAALSVVTQTELLLMVARIDEAKASYITLFNAIAEQADPMLAQLRACTEQPLRTKTGLFLRDASCLAYFSSGLYADVLRELTAMESRLLAPLRADADAAFQSGALPSCAELSAQLRTIGEVKARCSAAILAANREMELSDARESAGQCIAQQLAAAGYLLLAEGFEENQPLNAYVLSGELMDSLRVHMRIAPVRFRGIAERNSMTLSCEPLCHCSQAQAMEVASVWKQRIAPHCADLSIMIHDQATALRINQIPQAAPQPMQYAQALSRR